MDKKWIFGFLLAFSGVTTHVSAHCNSQHNQIRKTQKTVSESNWVAAIESGNLQQIKQLAANGINLNKQGLNIPLRLAVERNQAEVVRILLDSETELENKHSLAFRQPSLQSGSAATNVLSTAIDKPDILELLLNAGADPNLIGVGERGADQRPLLLAIRAGSINAVRLLLAHGAKPNLGGEQPDSPLSLAVDSGHLDIVELLIQHKANVNILASTGKQGNPITTNEACRLPNEQRPKTPLDHAIEQMQSEISQALRAAGALTVEQICSDK